MEMCWRNLLIRLGTQTRIEIGGFDVSELMDRLAGLEGKELAEAIADLRRPTQELRIEVRIKDQVLCWAPLGENTVGIVVNSTLGGTQIQTRPLDQARMIQYYQNLIHPMAPTLN